MSPSPDSPKQKGADSLSPVATLDNPHAAQRYSFARRYFLLIVFCLAQFLDAVNNCSLFCAIPSLIIEFGITESEATWIISAFQLTFASFLLISGKVSDIYNPKITFVLGLGVLGILSIGAGFVKDKISLIVLRALTGIAGAMTIPSALNLIVHIFPEPSEQGRAIGVFGGCGAIGSIAGLLIGAVFVQFANWRWNFWFVAICSIPIATICVFLIPRHEERVGAPMGRSKWKNLDLGGVSILTAALILFIYSLTSGSADGWNTAGVLAPLIISILMVIGFFFYETRIPAEVAAVPPSTWFLPNFAVLFGVALLPYFWWTTTFVIFTTLWQNVYHWSVISTAARMTPIGVFAFIMSFSSPLSRMFSPKYVLLAAQFILVAATILLHFAGSPDAYFPFVLPAFILGTTGCMVTFTHTNIAIFRTSPSSMAGTVGAIFNGALQLGSAVGLAAVTSIQTSVEKTHGGSERYDGRAAVFWFLLGIVGLEIICISVFYRVDAEKKESDTAVNSQTPITEEKQQDVQNGSEKVSIDEKKSFDPPPV